MGKKRRSEVDLDAERTLYSSFSAAANSISQLYTQAVQQQRKATSAAAKQAIDKLICGIVRDFGNCQAIPVSTLLQYLQHEYENLDNQEVVIQPHPLQGLPPVIQAEDTEQQQQKMGRSAGVCLPTHPSPARRANLASGMSVDGSVEHERGSMMDVSHAPQFGAMGHPNPFGSS